MSYRLSFLVREPDQVTRNLTTQGSGPRAGLIARRLKREYDADVDVYYVDDTTYCVKWYDRANERYREATVTVD